ncbi:helix-turn-helix domain-containing protein [Deinococcus multiflagellatus]|uniref:Helix-turn-helix domain-containing protein n=1 Tax=Deinococcus multiflagellatus TaxID=1656887 RepID=A0ABW1ZVB4_9DEIO|nr:ATP-binding protein [Deinococcus multiflagellatus]MBZ9714509.1 ATP-binding protein [Deinococcus multiflagellatus]
MTLGTEGTLDLQALLAEALASGREAPHYDFKEQAPENVKLLRHLVALSNLPRETPGGRAYLFIGVNNNREVVGLRADEPKKIPTADKREVHLNNLLRENVDARLSIRVHELKQDDKTLHIVEMPCLGWPWRQLHRDQEHQFGFWVRHGTSTVRPTTAELAAQWAQTERALQDHVVALESALVEQRQVAQTAVQSPHGSALQPQTSIQAVHLGFATPERTLLRLVRRDISQYLQAHSAAVDRWAGLPHFQLDRLTTQLAYEVHPKVQAQVQAAMEGQEAVVRPLVELVAVIMHDADPTDRVQVAVMEIAQAVAFTAFTVRGLTGPTYAALRAYPGYLLCFGACAAAMPMPDLTVLGLLLKHRQRVTYPTGRPGHWDLIESVGLRPHLDALTLTFDRRHPVVATAERARKLFHQADWLGASLPATIKSRLTRHAEVLLLLAYAMQARGRVSQVPYVDGAWTQYPAAQETLQEALYMIRDTWPTMQSGPLEGVVSAFDEFAQIAPWPYPVSALKAYQSLPAPYSP